MKQQGINRVKSIVFLQSGVFLISGVFVYMYCQFPDQFVRLCDEDGIIENLTSLAFLVASVAFLHHARKGNFQKLLTAGLGLLCVVAAGEEISWGQRVFGIQTPDAVREVNVQHELNLHNLEWIQGHYRIVMLLFLIAFCLLLPLMAHYRAGARRLAAQWKLPLYPRSGVLAMTLAIAFMAVPRLLHVDNFRDLDEVGELLVAIGFLLYAIRPGAAPSISPAPAPQHVE